MQSVILSLLTALLVCTTNCALAYSIIQYRHLKCMIPRLSRDTPRFDGSSSSSSYSAFNSRSKFNAALRVSLDQSVLPKSRLSFRLDWTIMVVAVAAVIVSIFKLRLARRGKEGSLYSDSSNDGAAASASSFDEISTNFKALFTIDVFAPIKNIASWLRDNTRSKYHQQQSKKTKPMSLDIWNVCRLANIEKLGDQYSRYRFDVTSYPDGVLPLDIGQEVCMYDPSPLTRSPCSMSHQNRSIPAYY